MEIGRQRKNFICERQSEEMETERNRKGKEDKKEHWKKFSLPKADFLRRMTFLSKLKLATKVFGLDWVFILVLLIVGFGINSIKPYERLLSLSDTNIAYPQMPETVPVWLLILLTIVFPILSLALSCLLIAKSRKGRRLHHALLGRFQNFSLIFNLEF